MVHHIPTMNILLLALWLLFAAVSAQQNNLDAVGRTAVGGIVLTIATPLFYAFFPSHTITETPNGTMSTGNDFSFPTTSSYLPSALPTSFFSDLSTVAPSPTALDGTSNNVPAPFCSSNETLWDESSSSDYDYVLKLGFTPLEEIDLGEQTTQRPFSEPPLVIRVLKFMRGLRMDLCEVLTNWATQYSFELAVQWLWARRYRIRNAAISTVRNTRAISTFTAQVVYHTIIICCSIIFISCVRLWIAFQLEKSQMITEYKAELAQELHSFQEQQRLKEETHRQALEEKDAQVLESSLSKATLQEELEKSRSKALQSEQREQRLIDENQRLEKANASRLSGDINHPATPPLRLSARNRTSILTKPESTPVARNPCRIYATQTEAQYPTETSMETDASPMTSAEAPSTAQASTQTESSPQTTPDPHTWSGPAAQCVTMSTQTDENVAVGSTVPPTAAVPSLETTDREPMSAHTAVEQESSKKCTTRMDPAAEGDSFTPVASQPIERKSRQVHTREVSTTAGEEHTPGCIALLASPLIQKIPQKTVSSETADITVGIVSTSEAEAMSEPETDEAKAPLPPNAVDIPQWRTSEDGLEIDDDETPTPVLAALTVAADSDPTDQQCEMVAALAPRMSSAFTKRRSVQDRAQQNTASILPDQYIQALIVSTDHTKQSLNQSKFAYEAYRPQDLTDHGRSCREIQPATSPVGELKPQLQQPATIVESENIVPVSTVAESTPTVASAPFTFDVSRIFTAPEVTRTPAPTPFKVSSLQPFRFDSTEASVVPDIDVTGTSVAPRANFIEASVVPTFNFITPSVVPTSDLTGTSAVPGINFTEASGNPFSHSPIRPTLAESSNIPAALDEAMDASLTGPALEAPFTSSTPAPSHIISSRSRDGPQDIASPIPGLELSYSSINIGAITDDTKADQDMEVAEDADEEDIYGMDTNQDFVEPPTPEEEQDRILNKAIDENWDEWVKDADAEDQGQPKIEEPPLEPSQDIDMRDTAQHNSQSVTRVHPSEYYEDIVTEGPSLLEQAEARRRVGARDSIMAHLSAKRMAASGYREVDTPPWTPTPNDTHNRQSSSGLYQTSTDAAIPDMPDVDAIIYSSQDQQNVPYTSATETEQGSIPGLFMPQPSHVSPPASAVVPPADARESLMRARDVQLGIWGDSPRSPVSSNGSESEYEPPPAGYVTATYDTHDGTQEAPLPPVLAHNPTTEDDMQDAPHDSEAHSSSVLNDAQDPTATREMQDGVDEAPFSPVHGSSPVYGSASPVYGSTSPVYGPSPVYRSSPALNDLHDPSPDDEIGDDMDDDMSDASDLTEIDEVEARLEAHVGGMPAPQHTGRHTAVENGQFVRSINEMGGPHQPNADERGLSRAMGVHAASRLEYDPDKPKLKRNCQSEESDEENVDDDEWSVQNAKRVRRLDEDIAQFKQLQLTEEQKQTLQQLLTPPLTTSADSTPVPESDSGETRPAQPEKRARDDEDDDDDFMEDGHTVKNVQSSSSGYGHGAEIQRYQQVSEDTGETRSAQAKKRARGDEDDDDDLMEDGPAIKNVRFSTFGYGYGEEVQRYQHISEDTTSNRKLRSWEMALLGIEDRFTFSTLPQWPPVHFDFDNLPPMQDDDQEKADDSDLDMNSNVEETFYDADGHEVLDSEDIARQSVIRDGWQTTSGMSARYGNQGPAASISRLRQLEQNAARKRHYRLKRFNTPGTAPWRKLFTGPVMEAAILAKYEKQDKEEDKAFLMRTRGITEAPRNIVRNVYKPPTEEDTAWGFFDQAMDDQNNGMDTS